MKLPGATGETSEFEWSRYCEAVPELQQLEETPQDPKFHGEGDVATHIGMVWEALHQLEAFRDLTHDDQQILRWLVLFHDIRKAKKTLEEDGKITSRGHDRESEEILRDYLWRKPSGFSTLERERLLSLVRLHGSPVHFLKQRSPEAGVIELSWLCPLDLLTIFVEADMRGRICEDPVHQEQGLEAVRFFRETAQELQCYERPRKFGSSHARVAFFQKPDLGFEAYDDRSFEVVMMAGLPGAGKDTHAARLFPEIPVVSLDEIRERLGILPTDNQGTVIQEAKECARIHLRKKESFVWNATNLSTRIREGLIGLFVDYGASVRIVWVDADRDVVLRQNGQRQDPVPASVIERMARRLDFPQWTEAHELEVVGQVDRRRTVPRLA